MPFQPQLASGDEIRFTATGAVTAGVPVTVQGLFVIPVNTVASGVEVNAKITGVHQLTKKTGVSFAEGAPCYWDAVALEVTDVPADGIFIGNVHNLGGAATARTTVWVRLAPDGIVADAGGKSGTAYLTLDATSGLAIGTVFGDALPDNARATRTWHEVITTFADGVADLATISLGIETVDVAGIQAATTIADVADLWDAGLHEGIQVGTTATFSEKTTAAGQRLQAVVGAVALTDGFLVLVADWSITA